MKNLNAMIVFSLLLIGNVSFSQVASTTKTQTDNSAFNIVFFTVIIIYVAYRVFKFLKREQMKKALIIKYPQYSENIKNKSITLGMPLDLVYFIFGKPGERKEQVLKDKTKLSCFFGSFMNRRKNIRYKLRVDFENENVVGWKDL